MRLKHQLVLIAFTVYVPTNSGLQFVREEGLKELARRGRQLDIRECRGENIPYEVATTEGRVAGITGEDLLANFRRSEEYEQLYIARGRNSPISEQQLGLNRRGPYEESVFGLPALCVLGKGGMSFDAFTKAYPLEYDTSGDMTFKCLAPTGGGCDGALWEQATERIPDLSGKRVAIPKMYENIIRYLVRKKAEGTEFLTLDGKVDVTTATDNSIDYAIDIVLTGKTCKDSGLGIFERLYLSDGIILWRR